MKSKWRLLIGALVFSCSLWLIAPTQIVSAADCDGDPDTRFRSAQNGYWNTPTTWECSDNGTDWETPDTQYPNYNYGPVTIRDGHNVVVSTNITTDQTTVEAGGQLTINCPTCSLRINNGSEYFDLTVNGTLLNQGAIGFTGIGSAYWTATAGATFIQNTGGSTNLLLARATLDPESTFIYRGSSTVTPNPSMGYTYGNLIYESESGTWSANIPGITAGLTVAGDFSIGSGVTYRTSQIGAMNFAGNFTNNGDLVNDANEQIYNFTGAGIIGGSSVTEFETWNVATSAVLTLTQDITITSGYTGTVDGTLTCVTHTVLGAGNFVLASGGTLNIGSPDGISATGNTGNIQVAGTRSFSTGANYAYIGTGSQITGSGFPSTAHNLTIASGSYTTLSNSATVNGAMVVQANATFDASTHDFSVASDGTLTNNGTLRQQKNVSGNTEVGFFNYGGYGGLLINANSTDLGNTSIIIKGNQDCTTVANETVQRCFEISPANSSNRNATLTFFFASSEVVGSNTCDTLNVYHWNGSSWDTTPLTLDTTYDGDGRLCTAEPQSVRVVNVTDFSPFGLKTSTSPTAITLYNASATSFDRSSFLLRATGFLTLLLLAGGVGLYLSTEPKERHNSQM